jgi:hypothetical protein
MHIKFPYRKILVPAGNGQRAQKSQLVPVIHIRIFNKEKYLDCLTYIDSGSPNCLFPGEYGEIIGIKNIESGHKRDFFGLTYGIDKVKIPFYSHSIEIEIGGYKFPCEGYFSRDYKSQALLGQYGFFNHFRVTFDFQKEEIELAWK